jgi:GNAT superfamily N-acetyltransferase
VIRPADEDDLRRLQEIEVSAGQAFRGLGMTEVADDDPPSHDVLEEYARAGRAWVAERDGEVAAYLLAEVVDGAAHVEQVSVHADHAGHGVGRALVEHLAAWARARGLAALTLTTFAEVPWKAPLYARAGFVVVPDDELLPGLRAVRDAEAARGLDRWPRVAMRRPLDPS